MPLNTSVTGTTLGIVGLGHIGKAIAARAEAFGMDVRYFGRQPQPSVAYTYYDDLLELARDVAILVPAVPAVPAMPGGPEGRQPRVLLAGRYWRQSAPRITSSIFRVARWWTKVRWWIYYSKVVWPEPASTSLWASRVCLKRFWRWTA